MFATPLNLRHKGLFVTATDTGVGKTLATCAIAWNLRRSGLRVGVCKPLASGCRRDREGLVSEDAEALAHFADCRQPLDIINPVRFVPPVAPAVAEELTGQPVDFNAIAQSLRLLDESSDVLLIEGVGGLLVPLARKLARPGPSRAGSGSPAAGAYFTVLDLAGALGYPVVVVARSGLGTINHATMTVQLLQQRDCQVAGLIVNGFEADAVSGQPAGDLSMSTNRAWLQKMTGLPILATIPQCPADQVVPPRGRIAEAVLEAVGVTYWADIAGPAMRKDE
jgi:dethiobiotin synthetase